MGVGPPGAGPRGGRRSAGRAGAGVYHRDDGDGEPVPQGVAAAGAGRPGLALRAHQVPVQLHRGADERRAGYQPGPAHGVEAFRSPDEPARRGAAARGPRPGARRAQGRPVKGWRVPVTVAAVLVAYAACAGTLGSRMLGRAKWTARAPLLAIVTYLAAGWSVIAAVGLAGLTLAVHATALAVRTALTATAHFRAAGRQALRHAQTARLVGHPEPALGAVLVEHSQPAAYCVAGRQPTVILTTGAVQALDPGQLDAVLAHERAHLAGRHHWLVAMARIGHEVLPFLPLMQDAEEQVARMVELHADDAATRARDPRLLATALVVLATPGSPAPALAAGATDSVQRIHRLLGPSEPLGRVRRQLLRATAAALALTPVLLALTPAMVALALGKLPGA